MNAILIAEDSPTQAQQLKFMLERRGYAVTWAANGGEALAAMDHDKPSIVLSDIVMPGMDGYQLCKSIRAREDLRDIPIILLTSLSDPEDVIKGLECGADSFITKPYDETYLVSRIEYTMTNCRVRELERSQMGVEVVFAGRKHFITSDRLQILNLLLSTYETAVHKNQQLSQARDGLRSLNEKLVVANQELDAFAYTVSHDLRTPLRHVLGFGELLEKRVAGSLDPTAVGHLRNILDAAGRMSELIDDLLSFSRTGRSEMRRVRVNMRTLVEELMRELAPETAGREVAWKIGELPEIDGDPSLLKQVWANLMSNAIKFTRKRAQAVIEIAALAGDAGEPAGVTYMIRDNGAGFDMRYADKLFGVFQRLHAPEDFEGTGIGLATVRRILHRHGGKIWAEGAVDQGATFFFRLPA